MSFVPCKNPLKLYQHYILESRSITGKYFDRLQYCGVCRALAFIDNNASTNPIMSRKVKPFPDSQINNKIFVQCEKDSL